MKRPALRHLDFSLLPVIESMDMFIRLDRSIEEKLKALGCFRELGERAEAALMFFFLTDGKDKAYRNDAKLRAGLNEVYSIEAAAIRDLRAVGSAVAAPLLRDSRNPLVHLLYILRHVGVHSAPVRSDIATVNVVSEFNEVRHEYSYGAVILEPLTIDDLSRSREVNDYYQRLDLEKMIEWTKRSQTVFGVSQVFRMGLNSYVAEIINAVARDDA